MKQILVVFISVFLAEIGDKTQLATMLFATDRNIGRTEVFFAAAGALVASTLIAVFAGDVLMRAVSPSMLKAFAGVGFILVGLWTLISIS